MRIHFSHLSWPASEPAIHWAGNIDLEDWMAGSGPAMTGKVCLQR
jgi:hypothetical protein